MQRAVEGVTARLAIAVCGIGDGQTPDEFGEAAVVD